MISLTPCKLNHNSLPFDDVINNFQIMSTWSNAPWGFGSNGGRDGCVYSGPFGKRQFSLTNGECLRRNFNGNSFGLLLLLSQPLFGSVSQSVGAQQENAA